MVIDELNPMAASAVAGGIFNPLLPKHHKIAYNAENIYPMLNGYYRDFGEWLGERVLFEQPIHYILSSNAEQNDWSALAYSSHIGHWVDVNTDRFSNQFRLQHGYLKINHSGWVDTKKLTGLCREKLMSLGALRNEKLDHNALVIAPNEINYKDIKASNIIFCEGTGIQNNGLVKDIQLKPAKGEILLLRTGFNMDCIAMQGVFMLPAGDGLYRVGSNFSWDVLDNVPTEEGKAEILHKLAIFYKGDFEIVEHYAGVRPSSSDRRPIIGRIQPYENCYVMNGLGSKGVALAPYYGRMLMNHILSGEPIDKEVDTNRKLK